MSRTRVHNMNISLDGYAAGEHVTFDAPIGGAERLFKWFDGRVSMASIRRMPPSRWTVP